MNPWPNRQQILSIHQRTLEQHGGRPGIRDEGMLELALAQPHITVFGEDAYPTLVDKAAAMGHSIIAGHAFVDGNKRTGIAAILVVYELVGMRIKASVDEIENMVLAVADGQVSRAAFTDWLHDVTEIDDRQ